MKKITILLAVFALVAAGEASAQSAARKKKKFLYEEITFEDMMRRYLGKSTGPQDPVEGIYEVSCLITKRYKVFLGKREKFKVIERKDNYARVALVKDWPGSNRDYLEISLSYRDANRFPIVGTLNIRAEGSGLVYKHIEPDTREQTFSMQPQSADLIEGEYSFMERRKTITYKVSYMKIYPRVQDLANQ